MHDSCPVSQFIALTACQGIRCYGRSPWPIREQRELLDKRGTGPNRLLLVGHGSVRRLVMGGDAGARPNHVVALQRVLADPAAAARLRTDIMHEIARRGGAENVVIFDHPEVTVVGKSLQDYAAARSLSPVEAAIRLQLEGDPTRAGGGRVRGFSMSEIDMEIIAAQPWVATASDAGIALPEDSPAVHARFYGTFPRKIRHYALDRGALSLEDAIRSMTSLPAQTLGIQDRGMVREGMAADVVVLDLDRIRDRATFVEPHQFPEGIEHVLVNGALTWKLPGQLIASRPRLASAPGGTR